MPVHQPSSVFYAYPDRMRDFGPVSPELNARAEQLVSTLCQQGPSRLAPLDGLPVATDDEALCAAAERLGLWKVHTPIWQTQQPVAERTIVGAGWNV